MKKKIIEKITTIKGIQNPPKNKNNIKKKIKLKKVDQNT